MSGDSDSYISRENLSDQQWPSSGRNSAPHIPGETDSADELSRFPETVGTTEVIEAVRDGEPYTPPIDPPVLPGGPEGIHIASGFGASALSDEDGHVPSGDEELRDDVMALLANDSLTSGYDLRVAVRDGVVHLVGRVSSLDDAEYAMNLIDSLPGVQEVVDNSRLELTGI